MHPTSACCSLLLEATWWHLLWSSTRSHIIVLLVLNNLLWTMDIKLFLDLGMLVLVVWNRTSNYITYLKTVIHLIIIIMSNWTILLMPLCCISILELTAANLSGIICQSMFLAINRRSIMSPLTTLWRESWLLYFDRAIPIDKHLIAWGWGLLRKVRLTILNETLLFICLNMWFYKKKFKVSKRKISKWYLQNSLLKP